MEAVHAVSAPQGISLEANLPTRAIAVLRAGLVVHAAPAATSGRAVEEIHAERDGFSSMGLMARLREKIPPSGAGWQQPLVQAQSTLQQSAAVVHCLFEVVRAHPVNELPNLSL